MLLGGFMDKVFGRVSVIERIWKLLERFSILFTAERRVGKTTVLNEIVNAPKLGFRVIYSDLEKIDSPLEFVNDLLNKTAPFISEEDKVKGWFDELREALGGIEIKGVIKIPEKKEKEWKENLQLAIHAICTNTDDMVVFLWDELPYMLQKINEHEITKGSAERSSIKIMDTLRALRQEQKNLRMVFTGSIGLHHVLNTLTDNSYASEPINDMEKVELLPLDPVSATAMANYHLEKESGIKNADVSLVEAIISQCDYIPFYIEKLIRRLAIDEQEITTDRVNIEINQLLIDARDDWELEHFRKRLRIYYKGEIVDVNKKLIPRSVIAKAILNHCAASQKPRTIDDCYKAVKSSYQIDDRDLIIEMLGYLVKDHYLLRDSSGGYHFCFSLVQRWWGLAEGLNMAESEGNA